MLLKRGISVMSSLTSYIARIENNIRARERDGPSRVSPSHFIEDKDRSSCRKVMALECCILIKKWTKSKCSVTSVSETLCLKEWTISYIQLRKHTGIHHTKTVILIRATHSYKG